MFLIYINFQLSGCYVNSVHTYRANFGNTGLYLRSLVGGVTQSKPRE